LPISRPEIEDLFDDENLLEEVDDEETSAEAGEYDSEPADDAEVEEAERGIEDDFSAPLDFAEPSTESDDDLDDEISCFSGAIHPAITMYPERSGSIGYAITEYTSVLTWTRLERLAQFLTGFAEGRWDNLRLLLGCRRIPQRNYIEHLGGAGEGAKGQISELLRSSIISLNGEYMPAISFFCENVKRRNEGERMARELLSEGKSEKETREALQVEFDAARTTVLGWIRRAREAGSTGSNPGKIT